MTEKIIGITIIIVILISIIVLVIKNELINRTSKEKILEKINKG